MIKAIALKDFYYSKTKKAYRKDREYLFTKEQFEELYPNGFIISEIKDDPNIKKIEITKLSDKKKRFIKYNK